MEKQKIENGKYSPEESLKILDRFEEHEKVLNASRSVNALLDNVLILYDNGFITVKEMNTLFDKAKDFTEFFDNIYRHLDEI